MARKTYTCDCCGKERNELVSIGRDYNGDPDAPDACFFCRQQLKKNKVWSFKHKCYVYNSIFNEG